MDPVEALAVLLFLVFMLLVEWIRQDLLVQVPVPPQVRHWPCAGPHCSVCNGR